MEIRTILVNVDLDAVSPALVKCAAALAGRFGASLIGLAAAEPSPALIGVDGAVAAAEFYAQERADIEAQLQLAEAQFRAAVPAGIEVSWRGSIEAPNRSLAATARRADLIVTGSNLDNAGAGYLRRVDVGELVLGAGRPVLVASADAAEIKAETVVIGWKDTREARRAVADALPLLKAAATVVAVSISEGDLGAEQASLEDLLAWLRRHDIVAKGDVHAAEQSQAETLAAIAGRLGSDLIVTGGYGHSRLREWLFGGVTRDLLAAPTMNRFMSN